MKNETKFLENWKTIEEREVTKMLEFFFMFIVGFVSCQIGFRYGFKKGAAFWRETMLVAKSYRQIARSLYEEIHGVGSLKDVDDQVWLESQLREMKNETSKEKS